MKIDLGFPHTYQISKVPELPGTGESRIPWKYFPGLLEKREHDGVYVKVTSATDKEWVGVFDFGYTSPPAISVVLSTPDPARVCVISQGAAYFVDSEDPDKWMTLELMPIVSVLSGLNHGLIIFGDFSRLIAHDGNRIVWQSPRVCWDDLKIVRVVGDTVEGTGYDPLNDAVESRFSIDLRTGASLLPPPLSLDGKPVW